MVASGVSDFESKPQFFPSRLLGNCRGTGVVECRGSYCLGFRSLGFRVPSTSLPPKFGVSSAVAILPSLPSSWNRVL